MIMEPGKSKSAEWASRLETQGSAGVAVQVQMPYGGQFHLPWGRSVFLFYSDLQLIGRRPPTF